MALLQVVSMQVQMFHKLRSNIRNQL